MFKALLCFTKGILFLGAFNFLCIANAGSYEDFFLAVRQDSAGKVKELLIRGFDANTLDPKGQNGLHLAVIDQSLNAAIVLIEWPKIDLNRFNVKGESALMLASLKGNQELAIKMINKGADVNKTGWTPLHYAATAGQVSIISLLLDKNAYIDAESPNGTTPLMMAAMYGTSAAVNLLLQEGADSTIKNQQKLTALDFAQRGSRPDAIKAIAASIKNRHPSGQW